MDRVPLRTCSPAPVVAAALVGTLLAVLPASATPSRVNELTTREAMLSWMLGYRARPVPAQVPALVHAAAKIGAFREVDSAGVYVGFMAGVLGANPDKAEQLAIKMLAVPAEDHWAIVRAIAYSRLPRWKDVLAQVAVHMPDRKVMVDKYLAGKLPTLEQFAFAPEPGVLGRMRDALSIEKAFASEPPKRTSFEPSPDLIDTFWGYYFATGDYEPIGRLVAMLAWSKERDNVEKLTLGSMAKYTLSLNAARDRELLTLLKWARIGKPKATLAVLDDVIDAAETADTPRIRKEAQAAIDELKRKGPGYKRDLSWWGQMGEGAVSLGCIGAAVAGQVEIGVPCVVGGAVSSALLRYWSQP